MNRRVSCLLCTMLLIIICFSGITTNAADGIREQTVRFAWGETLDPLSHPTSAYANVFKSYVELLSNGKMKVELHPAGSLGTASQTLDLISRNTVQVATSISSGVVASKYCPSLNALNIPYLFKNAELATKVMNDEEIKSYLNTKLKEAAGIRILSIEREATRDITNDVRPITKPEDLAGLKIRVMSGEIYSTIYKSFGASPMPVPWAELYTALQTGVVDGQDNPPHNIVYKAMYECQKYMTTPGPLMAYNCIYMNDDWYSSLTDQEQEVIKLADRYACEAHRGLNNIKNIQAMKKLQEEMQVYKLSDEEYESFRKVAQPAVMKIIDKLTEGDKDFVNLLIEKIEEIEK